MKFLVVEDNVTLNQNIREVLLKLGESDSAYEGEEGLYMAEHGSYDLIV